MKLERKKMSASKMKHESFIVDQMILLYCKKKHKSKSLCSDCLELSNYCHKRLSCCPWGDNKPFCSNCPIHCYDKLHRYKIREVMRFSGPRVIFYHPVLACKRLIETNKERKRLKKEVDNGK